MNRIFVCLMPAIASMAFSISLLLSSGSATAQVTYADYLRADSIVSTAKKAYSAAVSPRWLGDSYYFWYKNHEKGVIIIISSMRLPERSSGPPIRKGLPHSFPRNRKALLKNF